MQTSYPRWLNIMGFASGFIILLLGIPIAAYAQQFSIPVVGAPVSNFQSVQSGVSTNTFVQAPSAAIVSAQGANGVFLVSNGQVLSNVLASNTITFGITGFYPVSQPSNLAIREFDCSVDNLAIACPTFNANQTTVSSSVTVTVRAGMAHTFLVRAVNIGGVSGTSASFSWTVTSSGTSVQSGVNAAAANVVAQSQATVNARAQNQTASVIAANLGASLTQSADANAYAQGLNPPLKQCDSTNNDLAIYKIEGNSNIHRLLQNSGTKVPINLILFADPNPTDAANQIVGQNNRFITAKLVAFPGNVQKQKVADMELTKIDTECKSTAIISQQEVIVGSSESPPRPAIVPPHRQTFLLNPPFIRCVLPTDAQGNPGQTANVLSGIQGAALGGSTTPTGFSQRQPAIGDVINEFAGGTISGVGISSPSAIQAAQIQINKNILANSTVPDISKYVIRGEINANQFSLTNGRQHIVFTLYVDLNPLSQPALHPSRILDTSDLVAATLQVNPGVTSKWRVAGFLINEIYTACETIPFVSSPMTIGQDPSDFGTQVVSNSIRSQISNH